ncbi:RING/U-box superfamily protein [Abeliophyllum distichum]|uniref:RING/U-box superfamily protein n=1 Tax=Abeliophyllum distichum TaxID=126358 RepID=A0ABD1TW00_9LAMI
MEPADNFNDNEHIIDITNSSNASSSGSSHERPSTSLEQQRGEDQLSTSERVPAYQPPPFSVSGSNPRNSSFIRRGNGRGRQRSPLNSGLWISVELVLTVSQIIAAIVVLSLSKHEHPHAPLKAWIVGYASGCVAILPLLYWRFRYRNQGSEHDSSQYRQDSSPNNHSAGPPNRRVLEVEDRRTTGITSRGTHSVGIPNSRLKALVEYFKMALDCFFAVWFVVGNVWIFGGHSSSADAPNLYRLCIVFLTFSCIGYAMPFILCATICCCLPCIISVLGFREDLTQNRGATQDSINALPTYKFKMKKNKNSNDKESNPGAGDGGVVAAGTEKERVISGEDAVCCICLARYVNNDELRELPCSHFFHKECVDKWLKINSSCPLCKADVGESILSSLTEATASLRRSTVL